MILYEQNFVGIIAYMYHYNRQSKTEQKYYLYT